MRAELDLSLNPSKLAGFVEGHGMRAIQDVITGLRVTTQPRYPKTTIQWLWNGLEVHGSFT